MKKHRTPQRLVISRTTVRTLTTADLARAAGATMGASIEPPADAFDGDWELSNCTAGGGSWHCVQSGPARLKSG